MDDTAAAGDPAATPEAPLVDIALGTGADRPGRGRRWPVRLAVAIAAVAAIAATAVAVSSRGGDDVDPEAALERAEAALADADSYRMTITTEERSGDGAASEPGTQMVTRVVGEVEVSADDWRTRSDSGDWVAELVAVGDTVYVRSGDDVTPIESEEWGAWPRAEAGPAAIAGGDSFTVMVESLEIPEAGVGPDDAEVPAPVIDEMLVSMAGSLYLAGWGDPALSVDTGALSAAGPVGPFAPFGPVGPLGPPVGDPSALAAGLADLDDAEVVAEAGGTVTIRGIRHAPAELLDAVDRPIPDGVIEVVLDAEDRPVSLTLTVEGEGASHHTQAEFRDWGADIQISPPSEADVDPTPWVDEEAYAEARVGVTPVRPTVLPEGIVMQDIYAITGAEAEDWADAPCAHLNLVYGPPLPSPDDLDPEAVEAAMAEDGYLDISLFPVDCALQADDTPFAPSAFGDVPSRELGSLVEVLIGDTVVRIDTTYASELPGLVASIQPFDLDAELTRLRVLAEEMWGTPLP